MPSRRQLLRTVGVGSVAALAGCNSVSGIEPSSTTNRTTGNETTTTPSTTTTEAPPSEGRFRLSGTTVLDDFEDLSGWQSDAGSVEANDRTVNGSQSMRVTAPKSEEAAWASKSVDWDLTGETLSIALDVQKPVSENVIVSVKLVAPDADNVQTMGELIRARDNQGWMRLDLATRNFSGSPDLSNVTRVDIGMRAADGAIDFLVDDLRSVPRPDSGTVVLTFDDSLESHYTEAFQTLEQYDMPGNVSVITGDVGSSGSLTLDQMSEMQDAGWEFASHGTADTSLLELSQQERWLAITDANDWLSEHGFAKQSSSFVYPHGDYTDGIIGFAEKYHAMGYRYMDPLSAASGRITDPMTIGRGNAAYDMTLNKTMVNYAELFHTLTVFTFHDIGGDGGLSIDTDAFRELVDYIDRRDVEVVTLSDVHSNLVLD